MFAVRGHKFLFLHLFNRYSVIIECLNDNIWVQLCLQGLCIGFEVVSVITFLKVFLGASNRTIKGIVGDQHCRALHRSLNTANRHAEVLERTLILHLEVLIVYGVAFLLLERFKLLFRRFFPRIRSECCRVVVLALHLRSLIYLGFL